VRRGSVRIGIHRHLTIRSSRPHVVASAACFTLRLHASAAPPRVGLTQALGGRRALCSFVVQVLSFRRLRLVFLFGQIIGAPFFGQVCQARSDFASVAVAGFGNGDWLAGGLSVSGAVASGTVGGMLAGRAQASGLRLSVWSPVQQLYGHPPPPNNSFKPTPCRGVSHVLCATLARVRRPATGRLNSSVRAQ
jgi:hypothetical protein